MRAIRFDSFGDYANLKLVDMPAPQAGDGQALVRMRTAAVNPIDETILRGLFPAAKAPPLVLGQEGCGVVVEDASNTWQPGTRVLVRGGLGIATDGTWREMLAAPLESLHEVPDALSDDEVAAAGTGFITALFALRAGGFEPGCSVLAPAFGGSVGNATVQLARRLGADLVVSTASTTDKAEAARRLGVPLVVDLSNEDLVTTVRAGTGDAGVAVAVDSVGGAMTDQLLSCLGDDGTVVCVGYVGGRRAEVDVSQIVRRRARLVGVSVARAPQARIREALTELAPYFADGSVRPLVGPTFRLEDAPTALRCLTESRPLGKVVLSVAEGS
ncbi:MAG TPA: zinc-binding alcohol dehydrogenase family protein [Acidimicrobiales bacterium]|nr:zinc-binding alcohol dehydrogenase family protein [Acidimicrobiales bacterium]